MGHTPEPWLKFAFEVYDAEDRIIADCGYSEDAWGKSQCDDNAARIVNCVNACKGIKSPTFEIPELIRANAELLEALKAAAINPNQTIVTETILKYTK
jgi:hypothetical protein